MNTLFFKTFNRLNVAHQCAVGGNPVENHWNRPSTCTLSRTSAFGISIRRKIFFGRPVTVAAAGTYVGNTQFFRKVIWNPVPFSPPSLSLSLSLSIPGYIANSVATRRDDTTCVTDVLLPIRWTTLTTTGARRDIILVPNEVWAFDANVIRTRRPVVSLRRNR